MVNAHKKPNKKIQKKSISKPKIKEEIEKIKNTVSEKENTEETEQEVKKNTNFFAKMKDIVWF